MRIAENHATSIYCQATTKRMEYFVASTTKNSTPKTLRNRYGQHKKGLAPLIEDLMQEDMVNEAQMILFQIARKNCGDYSEQKLKNNVGLRKRIAEQSFKEAQVQRPDISGDTWVEASEKLAEK